MKKLSISSAIYRVRLYLRILLKIMSSIYPSDRPKRRDSLRVTGSESIADSTRKPIDPRYLLREPIREIKSRRKMSIIFYCEAKPLSMLSRPETPEIPFKVLAADAAQTPTTPRSRNDSISSLDFRYFRPRWAAFAPPRDETTVDLPEIN